MGWFLCYISVYLFIYLIWMGHIHSCVVTLEMRLSPFIRVCFFFFLIVLGCFCARNQPNGKADDLFRSFLSLCLSFETCSSFLNSPTWTGDIECPVKTLCGSFKSPSSHCSWFGLKQKHPASPPTRCSNLQSEHRDLFGGNEPLLFILTPANWTRITYCCSHSSLPAMRPRSGKSVTAVTLKFAGIGW